MAKVKKIGICGICGKKGPLSPEHIPPQSAFNKQTMWFETFDEAMSHHPLDPMRGKIQQGGFSVETLCEKCNNDTGAWYGNEYKSWAVQAAQLLAVDDSPKEPHVFKGHPGRFFKQVVTIFMSVDHVRLLNRNPGLHHYLMFKGHTRLPRGMKVYAYFNPLLKGRMSSDHTIMDTRTGSTSTFLEFTYFPFGFVMTENSPPPDERLVDITHLARYKHDEYDEVPLRLPSFPVLSQFGGIYNVMDEVRNMRKTMEDGGEESGEG